jgi:hypothetical protein
MNVRQLGYPDIRYPGTYEFIPYLLAREVIASYERHKPFSLSLVSYGSNGAPTIACYRLQDLLDLSVGDHFTSDLAETGLAIHYPDESVRIHGRDVARDIPSVSQNSFRFRRSVEVAEHAIGAPHKQQAGISAAQRFASFAMNDLGRHTGNALPNGAGPYSSMFDTVVLAIRNIR